MRWKAVPAPEPVTVHVSLRPVMWPNFAGRRTIKLCGAGRGHDPPQPPRRSATMARRDPETNPAAFLGGELRRARVAAGFSSQDALAAKLGFDRTVVAKAETGERPPTDEVLAARCRRAAWTMICSGDGRARPAGRRPGANLVRGLATGRGRGPVAEDLVTDADTWSFADRRVRSGAVPGEQSDTSDDAIDALVAARLERQAILDRPDPPTWWWCWMRLYCTV